MFLGRVTGIHLLGYENSLAGKPDTHADGVGGVQATDGSATVVIHAVPLGVHHGTPAKTVEVRLVGCTEPLPNLKERGLFFIYPDSASAVVVWESDDELFGYWLARLGLGGDGR